MDFSALHGLKWRDMKISEQRWFKRDKTSVQQLPGFVKPSHLLCVGIGERVLVVGRVLYKKFHSFGPKEALIKENPWPNGIQNL
jgi:hypothetical protein